MLDSEAQNISHEATLAKLPTLGCRRVIINDQWMVNHGGDGLLVNSTIETRPSERDGTTASSIISTAGPSSPTVLFEKSHSTGGINCRYPGRLVSDCAVFGPPMGVSEYCAICFKAPGVAAVDGLAASLS